MRPIILESVPVQTHNSSSPKCRALKRCGMKLVYLKVIVLFVNDFICVSLVTSGVEQTLVAIRRRPFDSSPPIKEVLWKTLLRQFCSLLEW